MITCYRNNEIDREKWDDCIYRSEINKPYAYSWFLDIMAPGWLALVKDDYTAVFPLPAFSRFGINYVATPIFIQQLGAFSRMQPAENLYDEFLDYIPHKYKLIDLNIGHVSALPRFRQTAKVNLELDLSKPYEKLQENFSIHCRRNIASSLKNNPELLSDISPDEIIDLFIRNKGKKISGIKPRDYHRLRDLMTYCIKENKGRITGVRNTVRRLIYAIFLVETPGSILMLFVANTPESREKRTGYFVINDLIKKNAGIDRILDFAGSSIPSIAAFMMSFGSINNPCFRIYRNDLPWPLRILK